MQEIPPNQCKFLNFSIKIEIALIPSEGMKALYTTEELKETITQFIWEPKNTNTLAKEITKLISMAKHAFKKNYK